MHFSNPLKNFARHDYTVSAVTRAMNANIAKQERHSFKNRKQSRETSKQEKARRKQSRDELLLVVRHSTRSEVVGFYNAVHPHAQYSLEDVVDYSELHEARRNRSGVLVDEQRLRKLLMTAICDVEDASRLNELTLALATIKARHLVELANRAELAEMHNTIVKGFFSRRLSARDLDTASESRVRSALIDRVTRTTSHDGIYKLHCRMAQAAILTLITGAPANELTSMYFAIFDRAQLGEQMRLTILRSVEAAKPDLRQLYGSLKQAAITPDARRDRSTCTDPLAERASRPTKNIAASESTLESEITFTPSL